MAEQIIALRMTIDGKEVVATFQDVSVKLRNLGTEAERGGQKTAASIDRATKSVSTLSGQLDKTRANSERTFSSTRAGLESISRQLATMRNLVGAWIGATQITQVVQGIARMADEWSDLSSRIRVTIRDGSDVSAVMDRLGDIARATYTDLSATADSFARNAVTLNALGKSTQQQLDYTQALNEALVISGAKGMQFESVQNALSKAMATGALSGVELNTVLSSGSKVAELLARELGVNVNALREYGQQGAITGEVIFRALTGNMQELHELAETMPATLGDGMTLIRNSLLQTIGVFDEANGVSETLSGALVKIADNMGLIVGVVGTALLAWLVKVAAQLTVQAGLWAMNTLEIAAYQVALARMAATTPVVVAGLGAVSKALRLLQAAVPWLMALGAAAATVVGLLNAVERAAKAGEDAWRAHTGQLHDAASALDEVRASLDDVASAQPLPTEMIEQHTAAILALNEAEKMRAQLAQQAVNAQAAVAASQAGWFDSLGAFVMKLSGATIGADERLERLAQRQRENEVAASQLTASIAKISPELERAFGTASAARVKAFGDALEAIRPTTLAGAFSGLWEAMKAGSSASAAALDDMNASAASLNDMKARIIAAGSAATQALEQMRAKGSTNLRALASDALALAKANGASEAKLAELKATFDASISSVAAYEAAQKKSKTATDQLTPAIRDHARALIELEGGLSDIAAAEADYKLAVMDAVEKANEQLKVGMEWVDVERQLSASIAASVAGLDKKTAATARQQGVAKNLLALMQQELRLAAMPEQDRAKTVAAMQAEEAMRRAINRENEAGAGINAELAASYIEQAKAAAEATIEAKELEDILSSFDNIGFSGLLRDIKLVEEGIKRALDAGPPTEETIKHIARMQNALDQMNAQLQINTLGTFQALLGAVQAFQSEGSKGFKVLEAGMAALSIVQDLIAMKAAVSAVLTQGQGDPYTAWGRMAAMAAAVAPFLASIGQTLAGFGGSSGGPAANSAAVRQESQGTGTVLGDASAKSESIARAVEITANATQQLVGINRGMLRALQSMQAGLSAAGGMMARGAAGIDIGPLNSGSSFLGINFGNVFGGKESLRDQGVLIVGGMLSQMIDDIIVQSYASIHRSGGWFSSSKDYDKLQTLGDDVAVQFQLVLSSMADTVRGAAEALGLDMDAVNRAIEAYRIEEIRISTMDLSAEEAQAELAAVFSSIFDGLAGAVVPFVAQFQKVGEGLGETLVRVATSVQVMQEATLQLGLALDEADPERMAQISVGLMDLMGGIEDFIAGMTSFVSAFAPESHKFAVAQDALTRAFEQFGLTLPDTRDGMWDLMQSLDATTEAGREQIAMLLQLADVADSYYQMLEDREARAAAIDAALADNAWDQYLDGLTAGQRAIEETTKYYDDWRDSLIAAGATVEQLAELEDQRATAMARVYEAEAVRLAQAEQDYSDFIIGIWRETQNLSAYQSAMLDADSWRSNAIAQANEHAKAAGMAGASEQALALIERRASQLRAQALAQLREETQSLVDQLYGNTGISDAFTTGLNDASSAAADYWAQQRRAAETLQQYLDSMLLGDLSALTPEQQLAEAWSQLNAAVQGGDADQATRLADVYLRMLREMEASGDDYNQGFWNVRELLQGMLDDIGDVPDAVAGGTDSSDLITVAGAEQIAAQNRLDLAVQLAQHLADLSSAVGQTVYDLMDSMGVDLRTLAGDLGISLQTITGETVLALVNMSGLLGSNLLDLTSELGLQLTDLGGGIRELAEQTGINLDALTVESVQALGGLANQLGVDLADIATSVGADLGSLADTQSLLNQALAAQIDQLPDDQRDALREYFDNIVAATTEADANDAIDAMAGYINKLAPDIQDKLAPYFADVFPVDALSDLDYLTQISSSNTQLLDAAVETNNFLARIASNLNAANIAGNIPAYAAGGWVNGPTTLLAGEAGRELILPNPVSEFFQRVGIPVNAGSSDNGAVVAELRGIRDRLDVLERTTRSGSERVAAAVTDGDREARQQRDTLARQGAMERSTRL